MASSLKTPRTDDPMLSEIVRRLVEALEPDFMVVVQSSDLPGYRRDQIAYRALRGVGVPKDVTVWTRAEFDRRAHLRASLPGTILREGKLLHTA